MITKQEAEELIFHVPPECENQMIEFAYAQWGHAIVRRVTDLTDWPRYPRYAVAFLDDSFDYHPWDEEPQINDWIEIE